MAPAARDHGTPPVAAAVLGGAAQNAPAIITLAGGAKGGWNKALNEELMPNATYEVDGIAYQTDRLGRVATTTVRNLKIAPRDRNSYQQGKSVALKDGVAGDQGGHIVAARLGGPGEQINYHAMLGPLNQGAWKRMENGWARDIKQGKTVDVEIKTMFQGSSKRPVAFVANTRTDGVLQSRTFVN